MSIESILTKASERWNACAAAAAGALRLGILRDLDHQLHSQLTQFLAEGQTGDSQFLESWLERVRGFKTAASLEGPLPDLPGILGPEFRYPKAVRPLPTDLPQELRPKLERRDRDWERAIASHGLASGWSLWKLDLWIELKSADQWHRNLLDALWPNGIHLFVEPGQPPAAPHSSQWHGCWHLLLRPGVSHPDDLGAQNLKNPAFQWTRLYPPADAGASADGRSSRG